MTGTPTLGANHAPNESVHTSTVKEEPIQNGHVGVVTLPARATRETQPYGASLVPLEEAGEASRSQDLPGGLQVVFGMQEEDDDYIDLL